MNEQFLLIHIKKINKTPDVKSAMRVILTPPCSTIMPYSVLYSVSETSRLFGSVRALRVVT